MSIKLKEEPEHYHSHEMLHGIFTKLSSEDINIFDIGCGVPLFLFDLQMKYDFKNFTGVDIGKTESDLVRRYGNVNGVTNLDKEYTSVKVCYNIFIHKNYKKYGLNNKELKVQLSDYDSSYI